MTTAGIEEEELAAEYRIAVGYMARELKGPLTALLALDQRLSRIVARTSEPMLGQMRLAWWREMLGKEPIDRPRGDAVLDAIGEHWNGREPVLVELVNGWEQMLGDPPLSEQALNGFAEGRAAPLVSLALENAGSTHAGEIASTLHSWALTDAATKTVDGDERDLMLAMAGAEARSGYRFGRNIRGLAILAALARRSLERGGRPLMEGRGAAVTALRAGLTGR